MIRKLVLEFIQPRKIWEFYPMKKLSLAITILAMSAGSAFSADLPARTYTKAPPMLVPMYDWSGFYIGINGGGGSSHTCWDDVVPAGAIPQGCHNSTGGTAGGQIGYRWRTTDWVFGIEGQGNWADFSGSNVTPVGGNPFGGATDRTRIDAFGLITGQIGYAWNNVLVYVKGGAAVVSDKFDITAAGALVASSGNEARWGETIGAGLEVGFAPNWSVGIEYNHIFLDDRNVTLSLAGAPVSTDRIHQDVDIGLVRLNYRFGGPVIAKY
jgi:outer membrane immunogenic protein